MKLLRVIPSVAVLGFVLAACQTTPSTPPFDAADGRVTITFDHPEKFTDAKDSYAGATAPYILDELSAYLQKTIRRQLPEGEKVQITITDVDMAGDFEPARMNAANVRIMKAVYPPRISLSYVRTGADGKVISEGKDSLTNLNYQQASSIASHGSERLYYEKDMLGSWIRLTLFK